MEFLGIFTYAHYRLHIFSHLRHKVVSVYVVGICNPYHILTQIVEREPSSLIRRCSGVVIIVDAINGVDITYLYLTLSKSQKACLMLSFLIWLVFDVMVAAVVIDAVLLPCLANCSNVITK